MKNNKTKNIEILQTLYEKHYAATIQNDFKTIDVLNIQIQVLKKLLGICDTCD